MTKPVTDLIEKAMISAYRGNANDRMGDPTIHVTNLIDFCPRTYYLCRKYDRSYHPSKYFGIQTKWDFDIGHAVQRIQVERLSSQGKVFTRWECVHCGLHEIGFPAKANHRCKCNSKVFKPVDLRIELHIPMKTSPKSQLVVVGHVDFVFVVTALLGVITDSKSIKAEYFDKLTNPNVNYRRQGQFYMWMANHPNAVFPGSFRKGMAKFKFSPKKAMIAYGVKGSRKMPFKFFEVAQDKPLITKTEKQLKELVKCIETDKPPTQICNSQHNLMARQCPARDICFEQVLPGMGRKRR